MKIFLQILFTFLSVAAAAQIRIEVVGHPPFSMPEERLFISGTFNNWNPGNPDFELKKDANSVFFINLPDSLTYFEYKFTQGSWALVEGNGRGNARPNRIFERETAANPKLIQATIDNWERAPAYKFVIKSLPANTPHDASLYIAGNFNSWNAADPTCKMQRQPDGTFQFLMYSDLPKLEFKFTRGTWASVEGRESGKARPNRTFLKNTVGSPKDIEVDIQSWEDLSGTFNFYSIYDILLLFAAMQGVLFIIVLPTIQDYNRAANRWLVVLMGFVAAMLFVHVIWQHRELAQEYPKLLLLPDFMPLIYAPLFYFYLQKLLFQSAKMPPRWVWHFAPSAVQVLAYLPFFLMDSTVFKLKLVNQDVDLQMLFLGFGAFGWLVNSYYWWLCRRSLTVYKAQYQTHFSYEQNLHYLNRVLFIQAICLILWLFSGFWLTIGRLFSVTNPDVIERGMDTIWLVFSTITYFLGYYAIHQPEVFKVPQSEVALFETGNAPSFDGQNLQNANLTTPLMSTDPSVKTPISTGGNLPAESKAADESILAFKEKIDAFMVKSKAYKNPNLTLHELAAKLKMPPHLLSKVINDGFECNFFDFVNGYRIEEFKKLAHDPRMKNQTFLSLAFEVGFNSKTAFNRSFKKMTNQTPREFFAEK